jgi:hypothetical protein
MFLKAFHYPALFRNQREGYRYKQQAFSLKFCLDPARQVFIQKTLKKPTAKHPPEKPDIDAVDIGNICPVMDCCRNRFFSLRIVNCDSAFSGVYAGDDQIARSYEDHSGPSGGVRSQLDAARVKTDFLNDANLA